MTIAIGALVLALLERLERLRFRASPLWRAHAASDVIYLLTGYVAGGSLALAYIVATSHWLGRIGLPRLAAPRWASVPLALVALDLGNYAAHWLLHRVDALWEFHKAHHSSPTLDWLATFRSHLVEQTLRRLVAPALLIVAGVPPDAVVVAASLFTAWAMRLRLRRAGRGGSISSGLARAAPRAGASSQPTGTAPYARERGRGQSTSCPRNRVACASLHGHRCTQACFLLGRRVMESDDAREYEAVLRNRAQSLSLQRAISAHRSARIRERSRLLRAQATAARRCAPETANGD